MAEAPPSPSSSVAGVIREHAPLTSLLAKIPKKAQRGLMTIVDIKLTCVDANRSFIALGSSVGVVFLYNRATEALDRLRCQSHKEEVTCVRLHTGIEEQLALGTGSGLVYLFQLTSSRVVGKHLQQFCLDLHTSPLTCLHWSTNGMKLFSGCEAGTVVCTEVDFYQGQSKSAQILEEPHGIVQLDYTQKTLLVSTTARTILCQTDVGNQVIQVGQKDRKVVGQFGACYTTGITKADTFLYAARPGQRMWKADLSGTVESTLIFKDLFTSPHSEIQLIDCDKQSALPWSEFQFHKLEMLGEKYLLAWSESCVCVLDPSQRRVVGSQSRIGRVLDVGVCNGEVFVLRHATQDCLVRLAEQPESVQISSPYSSPVPSPVHQPRPARGASPLNLPVGEGRDTKNKSPFSFLQKNIFRKLQRSDKELGVPVGVEIEVESEKVGPSGAWGPEKESVPHLLEFSSLPPDHSGQSGQVVIPTPHTPPPHPQAQADLPPVISLSSQDTPAIQLYVNPQQPSPRQPSASEGGTGEQTPSPSLTPADSPVHRASPSHNPTTGSTAGRAEDFGDEIVFAKAKGKPKKAKKKTKQHGISKEVESNCSKVDRPEKRSQPNSDSDSGISSLNQSSGSKGEVTLQGHLSEPVSDENVRTDVSSCDKGTRDLRQPLSASNCNGILNVISGSDMTYGGKDMTSSGKDMTSSGNNMTTGLGGVKPLVITSDSCDSGTHLHTNQGDTDTYSTVTSLSSNDSKEQVVGDRGSASAIPAMSDSGVIPNVPQKEDKNVPSRSDSVPRRDGASAVVGGVTSSDVKHDSASANYMYNKQITDVSDSLVRDQLQQGAVALNIHPGNRPLSSEDIYDKYSSWQNQSLGDGLRPDAETIAEPVSKEQDVVEDSGLAESGGDKDPLPYTDLWAQQPSPGVVHSLSLSSSHVWISDKDEQVYYSPLSGPGLSWTRLTVQAKQIAVSPNGDILWRVHRNKAYAASKVTAKKPEGTKWIEAVRDVDSVALDNTTCWCIKVNGEVKAQGDLRRDRPLSKLVDVPCDHKLRQLACQDGVVWALTDQCQILVRTGLSDTQPFGTGWALQHSKESDVAYWSVALGPDKVGWAVDVLKRVWFCMGVTRQKPFGDQKWWQVSMSECVVNEPTAVDKLKVFAGRFDPQRIMRELGPQQGGVIACEGSGTWVGNKQDRGLLVCRSSMLGNHWQEVQLLGMASSTCWKLLSAGNCHLANGSVWAQQPNGELFAFPPHSFHFTKVDSPSLRSYFTCLSVSEEAAWGLTADGDVFIRTGMGQHCPLGAAWVQQDLSQIGDAYIVSISCGCQTVWAVDSEGRVFQRLGVKSASNYQLNPAWLPILSPSLPVFFTQVATGPQDCMVWALDNQRHVYARVGVTQEMPIGNSWVHVPGIQANELSVSEQNVWALGLAGELYCRRGIQQKCLVGDYWQKIPTNGTLVTLSAAANDDLWGISSEGKLFHRTTQLLARRRRALSGRQASMSVGSIDDGDWELV